MLAIYEAISEIMINDCIYPCLSTHVQDIYTGVAAPQVNKRTRYQTKTPCTIVLRIHVCGGDCVQDKLRLESTFEEIF